MSRRVLALFTIVAALCAAASSWAYFTTSGEGSASASVGEVTTPPTPTIEYTPGKAEVGLDWAPGSTLSDGETPVQGYYVTRYDGSTTSPACGTSPTSLTTSTSCTDTGVPDGTYTYQVVAVWNSFSATSSASSSVEVVIGGGGLANPIWTASNSQVSATGVTYDYSFTTATGGALTSVTMTVPPETAGTPAVGTVTGVPTGGTVSLSGNVLTYSFGSQWVNAGTAASIQITGLTNTPNVSSYTSQITTKSGAVSIDSGVTAAISFTNGTGTLTNPLWTTSSSKLGATGATYEYGFTTASTASLTSVTMTVPPETAGTPAVGTVTGVPSGGTVSLSANRLTYSFAATNIAASTAVSIEITGLTNTSTVGSYTAQITTNGSTVGGPSVPIDNGTTAAISFSGGNLGNPIWTTSNSQVSATGVTYNYSFTTATGAALTSVTMTVPPGTAGTPAVGTVTGIPAGGTVSLSGDLLTYSFSKLWVNAGTASTIQITGLTNTPTVGSYTSQITTNGSSVSGPSLPVDVGSTAAISFAVEIGHLGSPIWTSSKSQTGATGTAYNYSFTTATGASLTSVTMTVPPGTSGTPAVGAVKGLPTGGTVSLAANKLTYSFAATSVPASTAASIQITGLTNTSTAGAYTAQITTYAGSEPSAPIDNGTTAPVSLTAGTLSNPIWTASKSQTGATGASYTYSFTTTTAAALSAVTMTVPPGTAGTPTVGTVSGVSASGTIALAGNTLTYTLGSAWVNSGTAVSIQVNGLTNTSTAGNYTSQITTEGTYGGPPNIPLDTATTASVAFTAGALTNSSWTTSKSQTGATGTAYTYGFTTATTASLTSVTMTVPPGTAGTPAVGTVSGVPGGGTVSLANNTLTYSFAATSVAASTAASIQITGLTNTSTAGAYTSQITTNTTTAPIDNGATGAVSFSPGALTKPVWTASKTESGATGATYTYSFTAATSAALTAVTMTVPPGTGGTPARGAVTGVPNNGTVSLANDTLTYSFGSQWVNSGTSVSIQITGLTNTSTAGSYTSQVTTEGTSSGGSSHPLDSGITAAISFSGGTTPPTGTIEYTNGYNTTGTVAITFSAVEHGSGVNTKAGQLERASATLSAGSCGSFGEFEKVGPEGVSSPYSDSSVTTDHCYQYEYIVPDNYGNPGTITSTNIVKVDTTAPTNSLSLTGQTGGSYLSGATLYYRGSATGSFKIQNAVADSGSGPASSAFPALGGTATGWTHTASTPTTPAGGPYVSNEFKWAASTSSSPTEAVTGADAAGNTAKTTLTLTNDSTAPSGGSVSVPAYSNTTAVEVTFSAGTDSGSGINAAAGQLKRATGTYTELTDTCSGFGTFSTVATGPVSPFPDTGLSNGHCYEYEYVASDNVGNSVTYGPSSAVKVDTTAPTVSTISSTDPSGKTATGKIQNNSTLTITFNSRIKPASISPSCSSSCTITGAEEKRHNSEHVFLVIPGITASSDTGSSKYLSGTKTATATFTATVAFSSNDTVLTITVSGLGGSTAAKGEGEISFVPASTITDPAGNAATGTLKVKSFKLF